MCLATLVHIHSAALNFPVGLLKIGGVLPVWTLVLCVGIVLALVVTFTSKDDKPPKYHGPVRHCVCVYVRVRVRVCVL